MHNFYNDHRVCFQYPSEPSLQILKSPTMVSNIGPVFVYLTSITLQSNENLHVILDSYIPNQIRTAIYLYYNL